MQYRGGKRTIDNTKRLYFGSPITVKAESVGRESTMGIGVDSGSGSNR